MRSQPAVSVVVPVYNGSQTIRALVERIEKVLPILVTDFEVILINDGSYDESWQIIEQLTKQYPHVYGINFMRNYGQHNALLAGVRAAHFPIVVTMDDDLQHPPEEIPILLAKLDEGCDVVYGIPRRLPHAPWRNFTSLATKRFMASMIGIGGARHISAFRAFKTELRNAFATYQSPAVFLDVLLSWGTTRFTSVMVTHEPRRVGTSNYDLGKLIRLAMVLLTGFSTGPLRLATLVGFGFTCFGMIVLVYVVGRALLQGSIPGFPFLASIIAIFSGAQLFALGIIGEYVAVIHKRLLEQPVYVIHQTIYQETQDMSERLPAEARSRA